MVGKRFCWVWNGQWRRPFGTAAEWIVLPSEQAVPLPANIDVEAGACLGIPAYTGYQAVVLADGASPSGQASSIRPSRPCGRWACRPAPTTDPLSCRGASASVLRWPAPW